MLWAADEWSIAREHAATAVSDRAISAHAAITACRSAGVPGVAGGRGFGPGGRYAQHLGADAWAADAEEAVTRLATA